MTKLNADAVKNFLVNCYKDSLEDDGDFIAFEFNSNLGYDLMVYESDSDSLVVDVEEAKKVPHIAVEYDLNYSGGNYSGIGSIFLIPQPLLYYFQDDVISLFAWYTGIDPIHIVHYCEDEFFTFDGKEYDE